MLPEGSTTGEDSMKDMMGLLARTVLAAALLMGAGASADAPAEAKVNIVNMGFSPATLTVAAGTTVTWVNRDPDAHSVESKDKGFPSSPLLNTGEKYSYTFTTPGTYAYYCAVHASMTGKIVVTAN
jgi:plastocyanin